MAKNIKELGWQPVEMFPDGKTAKTVKGPDGTMWAMSSWSGNYAPGEAAPAAQKPQGDMSQWTGKAGDGAYAKK